MRIIALGGLSLALLTAACSPSAPVSGQSPSSMPTVNVATATAPQPTVAPKPATKELESMATLAVHLSALQDALKKSDIPGAKTSLALFNGTWSGTEVYVKLRSREIYDAVEDLQKAINKDLLDAPSPVVATAMKEADQIKAKYDDALKLAQTGKPLNPGLDDLATSRAQRVYLRNAAAAFRKNDVAGAKAALSQFDKGWPAVDPAVRKVAAEAGAAIAEQQKALIAAANAASPAADKLATQTDELVAKVTDGINAINAALPEDSRY